jgi:hypothetical protein
MRSCIEADWCANYKGRLMITYKYVFNSLEDAIKDPDVYMLAREIHYNEAQLPNYKGRLHYITDEQIKRAVKILWTNENYVLVARKKNNNI